MRVPAVEERPSEAYTPTVLRVTDRDIGVKALGVAIAASTYKGDRPVRDPIRRPRTAIGRRNRKHSVRSGFDQRS